MDGDLNFTVTGTAKDYPSGTEVVLYIDKQRTDRPKIWRTKVDKNGSFTFEIDQMLIYPDRKTLLTFKARNGSGAIEKQQHEIFCCSSAPYGFLHQIENRNAEQTIIVSMPGTELDGIRLTIPSNIKMNKNPRVVITIQQGNVVDIPRDRYIPLNAQVYFDFFGLKSISGIKYTIQAQPQTPRDTLGIKSSQDGWEHIYGLPWSKMDLEKEEVVILGHSEDTRMWVEIIPEKRSGNNIEFTLPSNDSFDRIVPAIKRKDSRK